MFKNSCFEINPKIKTISERELADYLSNKAIRKLNLVQDDEGGFQVVVSLNWKPGDWYVLTQRGKIRSWVSVDRFLQNIQKNCDLYPIIRVVLREKKPKNPCEDNQRIASDEIKK